MNSFIIEQDYLFFFTPRLEEEYDISNILYKSAHNDHESLYVFNDIETKDKAYNIYLSLKKTFKYDIEIDRLEKLLNSKLFNNYSKYSDELDSLLSFMLFEEFKKNKRLKILSNQKKLFIIDVDDLTYNDFMNNYDRLHKKIDDTLLTMKENIIQSDEYKIKKLNILAKIINDYVIEDE